MKLIAGLGNPGRRYAGTRHNAGFDLIAELARRWNVAEARYEARFEALLAEGNPPAGRVLLMQPQTYMNESGRSVLAVSQFYKLDVRDLLIVFDDVDLPVGQIRVRAEGSGGGQKGMTDVLRRLGRSDIARVRIGVGRPRVGMTDWVLGKFAPDEQPLADQAVQRAADACECWLARGIDAAMNEFNGGKPPRENQRRGEEARGPEATRTKPPAGDRQGESS